MVAKRDVLGGLPEPKPLYDPLLAARPMLWGILAVTLVLGLWRAVPAGSLLVWISLGASLLVQVGFLMVLPRRPVDALYLRAFGADDATFDARLLIEAALHPELRLAGIRAPRRRMPLVLRPFLFGLFALRYLGARYLSLEAQSDWLARLWRSLATVRVVFIDIRELTVHVIAETELAYRCVGLQRIVLVAEPDGMEVSTARLSEKLGVAADTLADRSVVWHGREETEIEGFVAEVKTLLSTLPPESAGLRWEVFPRVRKYAMTRKVVLTHLAVDAAQLLLGLSLVIAVQLLDPATVNRAVASAMQSPLVRILLGTASGYIIVPALLAVVSLFRRRPFERAIRRRSRGVLLRSFAGTTRTLTIVSLALGFAFHSGLEVLSVQLKQKLTQAHIAQARANIHSLRSSLEQHWVRQGRYPDSLEAISNGTARGSLVDPWGARYELRFIDGEPHITSPGPDGVSGSSDDVGLPP